MPTGETLRGTVRHYNLSPKGGVDGLILDTNGGGPAQVVFPPHEAEAVLAAVAEGAAVALTVEPHPGDADSHPVYKLIAVFADDTRTVTGTVARLNYAKHGEPNGVVLDTGDFVHLKPDGMRRLGLQVGDAVTATGESKPMDRGGRVVEAETANGVRVKGGPKAH